MNDSPAGEPFPVNPRNWKLPLFSVLAIALVVFCCAHRHALTNEFVINDDVRQQIFWMQEWQEPDLYPDDLLVRYARNYVPWGVQLIYYGASSFINPVQFSKILAGLLLLVTVAFLFALGRELGDSITGMFLACTVFVSHDFLNEISGGLARAFVFPLLIAYLFFLARENLTAAGIVILLQSVLNPYVLVLCLAIHGTYLTKNYGPGIFRSLVDRAQAPGTTREGRTIGSLLVTSVPVVLAVVMMVLKYVIFKDTNFGELVTWSDMQDKIEYSALGRYQIIPVPSLVYELYRPLTSMISLQHTPLWIGAPLGIAVAVVLVLGVRQWVRSSHSIPLKRLWIFAYLLAGSAIMYAVSYIVLMRLFIPRRYVEYSLTLVYCVLIAIALRAAIEIPRRKTLAVVMIVALLGFLGIAKLNNVGLYDYSRDADLCHFFHTTPKDILIAGQPDTMDTVLTFGRRNVFVSYELSHTWYTAYWKVIRERTYEFLRAYYSDDPQEIRRFCRKHGIDYLVVRLKDFPPNPPRYGIWPFEPFDSYIRGLTRARQDFAALDRRTLPVVYEHEGIRVLSARGIRNDAGGQP